jgi:hypothetical protein
VAGPLTAPARSYPQPRPAGNDRLRLDALDDDQLLAARGAGHEANGAPTDPQFVGEERQEALVGGTADSRRGDSHAEHAVDHAVDMVGPGTGGQANREANVVISQDSAQPNDVRGVRGGELHGPSLSADSGCVVLADVVVGPLAEQRLADANDRRAFLDRNVEIGAHPHRKVRA